MVDINFCNPPKKKLQPFALLKKIHSAIFRELDENVRDAQFEFC